jgi:uncharacterized iron-regulated membrane protein
MRRLHRWIMTVAALLLLYVAVTGIILQGIDVQAIYSHAPASDGNMQAIREGTTGPPGFSVITTGDYSAAKLPDGIDPQGLLATVVRSARALIPAGPFKWIELRMEGNVPVGVVAVTEPHSQNYLRYKFNAQTGETIGTPTEESPFAMFNRGPRSAHDIVKDFHRGNVIGPIGPWVDGLIALSLMVLLVTGLTVYFKMLRARQSSGRNSWFWR